MNHTSLSFGKYVSNLDGNKKKEKLYGSTNIAISEKMHNHVFTGLKNLSRYFPKVFEIISPKLSKLQSHFDMDNDHENKEMALLYKHGVLNTHMCINAMTEKSHTEMDSSYTIICVPKQIDDDYKRLETCFYLY